MIIVNFNYSDSYIEWLCFVFVLVLFFIYLKYAFTAFFSRYWEIVPGVVTKSQVRIESSNADRVLSDNVKYIDFEYSYQCSDKSYKSKRLMFFPLASSMSSLVEECLKNYPVGEKLTYTFILERKVFQLLSHA